MLAHRAHVLGEHLDRVEQTGIFEILHDFVTKHDGIDIVQRHVEERRQIVFFLAGGDGGDDLIEIEIGQKVGRRHPVVRDAVGTILKEDALESHGTTRPRLA
ncbi:MAG: hypothetical protein ACREML_04680, partial [Vulcanimicrobiaceae bacterium]